MKYFIFLFVLAGFAGNCQVSETRTVSPFNKIVVSSALDVYYRISDSTSLRVVGKANELSRIVTRSDNGTLFLEAHGRFTSDVMIFVSAPPVNEVRCSGAVKFTCTGTLQADSVVLDAAGASTMRLNVIVKKARAGLSGAGSIHVTGSADQLVVYANGASNLDAVGLSASSADIGTEGASHAKINVSGKLKAFASGASSIKIYGEAKEVVAESTGASSIRRISQGNASSTADSTFYMWNGKKVFATEDNECSENTCDGTENFLFRHWAGFSMGVNGLLTPGLSTDPAPGQSYMELDYSRCINYQFNPVQYNFHLYKNYINLVTGLGLEWRRYMLNNKVTLNPDSSYTWGIPDTIRKNHYNKNVFSSTLLQAPLLLEFNTHSNHEKTFHIAFGVIGQFMFSSRTKQLVSTSEGTLKRITRDNFNMNPFQAKAHVSAGYRWVTVFGEYNLTPLFRAGKGPMLAPFVVGIRLIPFIYEE